ncbi:MAG: hypothetical protein JXQ75_12485, partial [Phycisphaerae bacterium]|nr:hypothetical protein [Phycisphaerae bacterium]
LLSGPITAATIQRLADDYKRHGTNSTSDLLIRHQILEQAEALSHQLSEDLRKALQEMFFAIVQQREQDNYLRYREVAALRDIAGMSIGHDLLDREEQLKVIDALLAKEDIRDNRRVLESWRYALTRPGQGD